VATAADCWPDFGPGAGVDADQSRVGSAAIGPGLDVSSLQRCVGTDLGSVRGGAGLPPEALGLGRRAAPKGHGHALEPTPSRPSAPSVSDPYRLDRGRGTCRRRHCPEALPGSVVGAASIGGGAPTPRVDIFYTRGSNGGWLPWASLGGRALGAPGVTCSGRISQQAVYVRGLDFKLWRSFSAHWGSAGGVLRSDPTGLVPVGGVCSETDDVFALGGDYAVWEWKQGTGWHRIGGQSHRAPAATMLPDGGADLFVVGLDNALWSRTATSTPSAPPTSGRSAGSAASSPRRRRRPSTPALPLLATSTDSAPTAMPGGLATYSVGPRPGPSRKSPRHPAAWPADEARSFTPPSGQPPAAPTPWARRPGSHVRRHEPSICSNRGS
jgi:hypothetical protein